MSFKDCPLRNELKEGLMQYERETNLSPLSLIESLSERYLYDEGYLVTGAEDEVVPFPTELNKPPLKYVSMDNRSGRYIIRKTINGKRYSYGTFDYDECVRVIEFLESKHWNPKYSISNTKLNGKKQVEFLFNMIEKRDL